MITVQSLRTGAAMMVGAQLQENEVGRAAVLAPLLEKVTGADLLQENGMDSLAEELRAQVNPQIATVNAEYDKAASVMQSLLGRIQVLDDTGVQAIIDRAVGLSGQQMILNFLDSQMLAMDAEISRLSEVKATTMRVRQLVVYANAAELEALVSEPDPETTAPENP